LIDYSVVEIKVVLPSLFPSNLICEYGISSVELVSESTAGPASVEFEEFEAFDALPSVLGPALASTSPSRIWAKRL
jgi:hypothetical protein